MKIISIIVFICFLILPSIMRVGHIFFLIITKGAKAGDALEQPSPRFHRFIARRRLFYSLVGLYFLLFLGSLCWMLYETIGESFIRFLGGTPKDTIIMGSAFAIFLAAMLGIVLWLVIRIQRILKKFPQPDVPRNSEEYRRWQETYYREALYKYFEIKNILRFVGIVVGVTALIILVIFLLNYLIQ